MKLKKLLSHFIPYRKYQLTTERTKESILRTLRRITRQNSSHHREFHGTVDEDRFRIWFLRDRRTQAFYRNPPMLLGKLCEDDGKTVVQICARMSLFTCVTFAVALFPLLFCLIDGLCLLCMGDILTGLLLSSICAFFLLLEWFFSFIFLHHPANRAIKRLSHLLFAEVTSQPMEE